MNKTMQAATALGFIAIVGGAITLGGRPSTIHPPVMPVTATHTTILPSPTASHTKKPKVKAHAEPKVTRVAITRVEVIRHLRAAPSPADIANLNLARRESGMKCHLEYDGPGAGYEPICIPNPPKPKIPSACRKVDHRLVKDCIRLYKRKAETQKNSDGSVITNPAGRALVRECTSQYTDYAELKACLTQPHI